MDNNDQTPPGNMGGWLQPGANNVKLVYILYLVGFVVGISSIVGIVFAYVNRDQSEDWIETHYTYLIRTFWIGLLYFLISGLLAMLIIGFFLIFAAAVWVIVRCIIGLQKASKGEAIANPYSWWF